MAYKEYMYQRISDITFLRALLPPPFRSDLPAERSYEWQNLVITSVQIIRKADN